MYRQISSSSNTSISVHGSDTSIIAADDDDDDVLLIIVILATGGHSVYVPIHVVNIVVAKINRWKVILKKRTRHSWNTMNTITQSRRSLNCEYCHHTLICIRSSFMAITVVIVYEVYMSQFHLIVSFVEIHSNHHACSLLARSYHHFVIVS